MLQSVVTVTAAALIGALCVVLLILIWRDYGMTWTENDQRDRMRDKYGLEACDVVGIREVVCLIGISAYGDASDVRVDVLDELRAASFEVEVVEVGDVDEYIDLEAIAARLKGRNT